MKYNERTVEKMVRLIEEDAFTISEICEAVKINTKTFYEWKKEKREFRQAIQEAEDRRDETLATLARHSLREQLEGYIEVTERVVYEDDGWGGQKVKSTVVTKKKKAPNARILKLAMDRLDKKREKEELKNNDPESKPVIIKFPKEVDREETTKIMTDFFHIAKYGRGDDNKVKQENEEEDDNFDSVVINV